jgi:hypothetical protein
MSNRFGFTYKGLVVAVFGVALLIIGGVVSFLATPAQGGVANPRVFTPLGVVMMLLGFILVVSKGD